VSLISGTAWHPRGGGEWGNKIHTEKIYARAERDIKNYLPSKKMKQKLLSSTIFME